MPWRHPTTRDFLFPVGINVAYIMSVTNASAQQLANIAYRKKEPQAGIVV